MKVAVLNYSGNVGKTTVCRHLLAPRIPGAAVVNIETINADAGQQGALRGQQFGLLNEFLQVESDAVVDVGASNVEQFLSLMRQYRGSHQEFDYFVVPTVANVKQQEDTVATLHELARLGVEPKRMRLVLNMADYDGDVESDYALVRNYAEAEGTVAFNPKCVLFSNEVYEQAKSTPKLQIADLANDETDFKKLIGQTDDRNEKVALARRLGTRRLAQGVLPELDACFEALALA